MDKKTEFRRTVLIVTISVIVGALLAFIVTKLGGIDLRNIFLILSQNGVII